MILNWTGDNMKIIPAHIPTALDPSATSSFCTIGPGYNDVPDSIWAQARSFVTEEIAKGRIIEEWTKAPRPEKTDDLPLIWMDSSDGREAKIILVPATIRDINRPAVVERVVRNTFAVRALEKWSSEENRPDVQSALVNQIKAVNSGQIAG
jgi:hypothetical protein